MTDKMREELLPCPFCGNKEILSTAAMGEYWHHCTICKCSGGMHGTREKALEAWNTRAATKEAEKYREALEKIANHSHPSDRNPFAMQNIAQQALQKPNRNNLSIKELAEKNGFEPRTKEEKRDAVELAIAKMERDVC